MLLERTHFTGKVGVFQLGCIPPVGVAALESGAEDETSAGGLIDDLAW
jgi:hypothetical protein